ncbi:maltose alpha-D-glucosyltransferase [Nibrella viscosa]|uniref:Maltokinase n=1 Tax=Nibrella viscosa TaxID=1084524 RepID=A0ABP8KRL4_9BACT
MADQRPLLDDKLHWYKDAVIYELHIKAFRDGNGDGIGDFKGLLEKLDYLQELGITAIWLLPFYPSPLRDDGYDIADYYSINPRYGNIDDFKQLLDEAHKRNLKVITELVINHTSDQHPWFQRARQAPKGSPEREFYVWTDDPTQYKDVRIIFQDFEASNWTWDPVAQQYYWHRFFYHQPDLNYDSPLVQEEIFKILDYWCAMGVDGFRLDAVPYLFEREGTNGENLPETHAFLKKLRKHIDEQFPGIAFLAEANMWPEDSASYFGDGDECHMNYHFPVMPRMFMSLQMEDRYPITDIFDQTPAIPEVCQWAMFLRNHDELTLEMVTDEERDYMYKVYAKDPKARINLGIRHRLAPLMENNRRRIELMNSLLFSLPGTPVIYYGDEIGMGDNVYLGDRDGVRTPMQWSPDRNAGFSESNPQQLYLPTILDPEYHYESVNVEMQRRNTSSLFWFMKHIITMRKRYKAFSRGDMKFLPLENPKVLAFTRTYEDETLLIVVNLSKFSQPAEIDLNDFSGYVPVEVFSRNRFPTIREERPYFFTLSAHEFQWFLLEKVRNEAHAVESLPELRLDRWEELLSTSTRSRLESTLFPAFLRKSSWFSGNGRSIFSLAISEQATLTVMDQSAYLLLLEVSFESGLPEHYLLPVMFVQEPEARSIGENCPQAVISQLRIGDQEGLLCDALFTADFQQHLLANLLTNKQLSLSNSTLAFTGNPGLGEIVEGMDDIRSRIYPVVRDYTAITYDNRFFLKIYRKVDRAINPDVELSRYLCEQASFPHTPRYFGSIEWRLPKDSVQIGLIQELVENHGDGRSFMIERLNNYIERILARDREMLRPDERIGTLTDPTPFDDLPEHLRELLGAHAAGQAWQMGIRLAELHRALAARTNHRDFTPEEFSLHYQRSLFSSMQAQVRESYELLSRNMTKLPDPIRQEVQAITNRKEDILNTLKRIYAKKLDVVKIRIHGNMRLQQVLFTGKDMTITNFGGDPTRPYSERRLKRSPLRDVAAMIRSFYQVAYDGLQATHLVAQEDISTLLPFADLWAYHMSGFFMEGYLKTIQDDTLVPADKGEFQMMLDTYMLERAVNDLSRSLRSQPEQALAPIHIIQSIIR